MLDPVSGEWRLRLPDEGSPDGRWPAGDCIEPVASAGGVAAHSRSKPTAHARGERHGGAGQGRRARRRNSSRGTSRWFIGFLCFLALGGSVSGYILLNGGGKGGATHAAASATAAATCTPSVHPSGSTLRRRAGSASATVLHGAKAKPIDVRVTVLNGSGTSGQAQAVLNWMQNDEGFLRTSNGGPTTVTATTTLVYAPNHADQARTLAAAMRLPVSALHGTGTGTGRRDPMVLTLGRDFEGAGKPPAAPPTGAGRPSPPCRS
ncbi:LytR C-terminal domain-containing protein [Streptomyces sp. EWL5.16]